MQVESFKIPSQDTTNVKMDGKDWYCIHCHLAGDVTPCQACHRVFHSECAARAKHKENIYKLNQTPKNEKLIVPNINTLEPEKENTATNTNGLNQNDNPPEISENDLSNINNNCENTESDDMKKPELAPTAEENEKCDVYDDQLCSICNVEKFDTNLELEVDELNHLLSFILARIRSWVSAYCEILYKNL